MAIPDNELFESFLSKTQIVSEIPEGPYVDFIAGSAFHHQAKVLYLSYPKMKLSLDSVVNRIDKELEYLGCTSDYGVALATLGIIVDARDPSHSAVEHANYCLSQIHSAQLHIAVVYPNKPKPGYQIAIGNCTLKSFDPTKLLYWANRGGSSYPIDLKKMTGQAAFEREPFNVNLINWVEQSCIKRIFQKWGTKLTTGSIIDIYYQAVSEHYFRKLTSLIKDQLLVLEGGALVHFNADQILETFFSQRISLFVWKGEKSHNSWATLSNLSILHMNFIPSELFSDCENWLREELGFKTLDDQIALDPTIKSYCRFLQRAHDHRLSGRPDEAFLHFIIGLDLVFGSEGRSSEKVSLRVAFLVHRQFDNTFEDQIKILKRLYDQRSRYVHEGKFAEHKDLEDTEKICTEILWCLLASYSTGAFKDFNTLLKELDFMISATKATKIISEDELRKIGIPPSGKKRKPPNRIVRFRGI